MVATVIPAAPVNPQNMEQWEQQEFEREMLLSAIRLQVERAHELRERAEIARWHAEQECDYSRYLREESRRLLAESHRSRGAFCGLLFAPAANEPLSLARLTQDTEDAKYAEEYLPLMEDLDDLFLPMDPFPTHQVPIRQAYLLEEAHK